MAMPYDNALVSIQTWAIEINLRYRSVNNCRYGSAKKKVAVEIILYSNLY